MKRRKEREAALQMLYALEFNDTNRDILNNNFSSSSENPFTEFSRLIVEKYQLHLKELDQEIIRFLENWDYNRIAVIDKILLRMAAIEFLYFPDIPPEVTINETIEIAKLYSTESSGKFINGLMDSILKELIRSDRLQKTGRGLVSKIATK